MRVVVICPSFPPAADGEGEHCYQIADRLAERGHDVQVLTQRRQGLKPSPRFKTLAVMKSWQWQDLPQLASVLHASQADACILIYTARLYDDHPMITFVPTILRWRLPRARLLCLFEIARPPSFRSLGARWGRKLMAILSGGQVHYGYGTLLRDANAVAALGPTILAELQQHEPALEARASVMPPPPLIAAPEGFDAAARQRVRQRLGPGLEHGALLLAYFGFVYPGKGVQTLIQSLALLKSNGQVVRLLMAGGGRSCADVKQLSPFEQQMQQLAERHGVGECLIWQASANGSTELIAEELAACDVAVLPFDDGVELRRSSVAVVAAMGLPLVTTRPTVHEPAFVHLENTWLVQPENATELCSAVQALATDLALRERLSAGALAMAQRWFSWDVAMLAIEKALAMSAKSRDRP